MEQMDLFKFTEEENRDPITNTTCVVMNGECVNMTWAELFDSKKYNQLSCVTYVSSASFLSKSIKGFDKVELIIGIEKPDVKKAIAENLRAKIFQSGTSFFEDLSDDDKQRVVDNRLNVRFANPDCIVHSKFYLLSNSNNSSTRLIFGSANLTNTAFSNAVSQYEDIMVFDNDSCYDIYKKRFNHLYINTTDYIPAKTINKYKEGMLLSVVDFTPEEFTEELIETLTRENIIPICNEEILDYIQSSTDSDEAEIKETRATFEVITSLGRKKKGDKTGAFVMKSNVELEKAKSKIIDILFKHTETEMNMKRFTLTYNDADKNQYRIFAKRSDEEVERKPELFNLQASNEVIKSSLENMLKFIEAYKIFVSDNDEEELSRITEIILYAFASAYIFKLRQETSGSKADIPIMLVIGGRAASGKSNLLAYIDRILSGRHLLVEDHYIQYKEIEKKDAIRDLFRSENTYPLLVDEVATAFFTAKSASKGEELIKYLSNTLASKHPVMICTTNTATFNIPSQVERRLYFVKVDSCFDKNMKGEANRYYDDVMKNANNLLFRDFCYRMSKKIQNSDSLFGENLADYLYVARQIFKEYFIISGVGIPSFFPEKLYNDYEERGRNMWKTLYLQEKNRFAYSPQKEEKEATFTLNLKDLTKGVKDTQTYINYLKQDILVEEAGLYIVLKVNAFCDWIGVEKPKRRRFRFLKQE